MYSFYVFLMSRLRKKLIRLQRHLYDSGLVYPEELSNLNVALDKLLAQIIILREINGGFIDGKKNEEKQG